MAILSLAMAEGDLEIYRYLGACSGGDLASAIARGAEETHVSDISIRRARVVVAEMDFCREVADLPGLRDSVIRRSYWVGPISVGRIQLAMNIKAVALRNLGNGKYEIIYDGLPDGVFDFDPDCFVVLRHDGAHCELMEDGPGDKRAATAHSPSR